MKKLIILPLFLFVVLFNFINSVPVENHSSHDHADHADHTGHGDDHMHVQPVQPSSPRQHLIVQQSPRQFFGQRSRSAKLLASDAGHSDHEHQAGHSAGDGHSHDDHHRHQTRTSGHDHGEGHHDDDGHEHAHFIVTANEFGASAQFTRNNAPVRSQKLQAGDDADANGDANGEAKNDDEYLGTLPFGLRMFGSMADPEKEKEIVEKEMRARKEAQDAQSKEGARDSQAKEAEEKPENATYVTIVRHHNPYYPTYGNPNVYMPNGQMPTHHQTPTFLYPNPTYSHGYTIPSYYVQSPQPVWYNHYPSVDMSGHPNMRSHTFYTSPLVTYHYIVSHDGSGIVGTSPGVVSFVPRENNPNLPRPPPPKEPKDWPREEPPRMWPPMQPMPGMWNPMQPGRPAPRQPPRPRRPQPEKPEEDKPEMENPDDREPLDPNQPPPQIPTFMWPIGYPPGYIPMPPMQPMPMPPRRPGPMPPRPTERPDKGEREDDDKEGTTTTMATTSTTATTTTESPSSTPAAASGEKEENDDEEESSDGSSRNDPIVRGEMGRMVNAPATTSTTTTTTTTESPSSSTTEAAAEDEEEETPVENKPKEQPKVDAKEDADEDTPVDDGNDDEGLARENDDDFEPRGAGMDEEEPEEE